MKRTCNKLSNSDDAIDDLPLKYITAGQINNEPLTELKKSSLHACEICEKKFKNRYDYLIHNAKHIIIPLIKMLPYHCAECGLYCISEIEMNDHMSVKHNKTFIKPKLFNDENCNIKTLMAHVEDINRAEDEKPIKCLIKEGKDKNSVQNNETDKILQNFVISCKVDVEKFELNQFDGKDLKVNNITETYKLHLKNQDCKSIPKPNNMTKNDLDVKTHVKKIEPENVNRITEESVIINDIGNFDNLVTKTDPSSEFSDLDEDPIIILPPVKIEGVIQGPGKHDSIHFDDLMRPGIFNCKRCLKRFPNRYEAIVHEAIHLDLSIATPKTHKLKNNHTASSAPPVARRKRKCVTTCHHCHEHISDKKLHAKICFKLKCGACGHGFQNRTHLTAHESKCNGEAVVNICDTCLYLRARPKDVQYLGIVRLKKLVVKHMCYWCGKLCEDLSSVTLVSKQRLTDRIRFEGDALVGDGVDVALCKKRKKGRNDNHKTKSLSNRERLKSIQQRLKLMKK